MVYTRGEASSAERPQLVTVCRSVGAPRSPGPASNWSGPLVEALGADLGQVGRYSISLGRLRML